MSNIRHTHLVQGSNVCHAMMGGEAVFFRMTDQVSNVGDVCVVADRAEFARPGEPAQIYAHNQQDPEEKFVITFDPRTNYAIVAKVVGERMYEIVKFGYEAPLAGPSPRAEAVETAESWMPTSTVAFEIVRSQDDPNEPDGGTVHVGIRDTDLSIDDAAANEYYWTVRPCQ